MTVDTSHVLVTSSTKRENLYVSMTRGRDTNIAYVALDKPDESHAPPEPDEVNAHTVLYGVLQHLGGELSAHQMIVAEQERWSSIAQLGAEYETIGAVAQRDRWVAAIKNAGLTEAQVEQVLTSQSFGPLTAELRRAESNHHDVEKLLPALVARRSLDDAEDIGAVLISRVQKAAQPRQGKRRPSQKLVVGLIPAADGPMSPEMAKVLAELADLMEERAMALAEQAVEDKAPWLKRLGTAAQARGSPAALAPRGQDGRRPPGPLQGGGAQDTRRAEERSAEARRRPRRQAIRRARAIAEDAANAQDGRSRRLESGDGRSGSGTRGQFRPGYPQAGQWSPVMSDRRRREDVSPNRRRPSCSLHSGTSAPRFAATSSSTCPPPSRRLACSPRGLEWAIPVALVPTPASSASALAIQGAARPGLGSSTCWASSSSGTP